MLFFTSKNFCIRLLTIATLCLAQTIWGNDCQTPCSESVHNVLKSASDTITDNIKNSKKLQKTDPKKFHATIEKTTQDVLLPIIDIIKALVSNTNSIEDFEAVELNQSLLYEDNNGAYTVATNCRVTSRTKYFNVKWHYFWQFVHDKTLKVKKINNKP